MFPTWVQVIVGSAATVTALGVIYRKVAKPIFNVAQDAVIVAPIMRELIEAFGGNPNALVVLATIAKEFRTDSGSTLRDVVNKLTESADAAATSMEAARQLASDDRISLARVIVLLDILGVKADMSAEERAHVAAKLAEAQEKVDSIAEELVASQGRADASEGTEAGEAADAFARSDPTLKGDEDV